jgi:hypothetical protein
LSLISGSAPNYELSLKYVYFPDSESETSTPFKDPSVIGTAGFLVKSKNSIDEIFNHPSYKSPPAGASPPSAGASSADSSSAVASSSSS